MTHRLIDSGWAHELQQGVEIGAPLRVVCPFITVQGLAQLLSPLPKSIKVITRFNLADFATGVSETESLRILLRKGARVRGARHLHAKLYLFGAQRAIVTSANLTDAALRRNHEFGLISDDPELIAACAAYFDQLWERCGKDLQPHQIDQWDERIKIHLMESGLVAPTYVLPDFGADAGIVPSTPDLPVWVSDATQSFVKFLGDSKTRAQLTLTSLQELEAGSCDQVVAYPEKRRPRSVKDGALMFIGRLTQNPADIRIFGWASAFRHDPERDNATPKDLARWPWRKIWPRYIRVRQAEFLSGFMANAVSLNELMDALGSDAFLSTQRNAASGSGNTDPRHAFRQQPAVELTSRGKEWLAYQLLLAFERHGKIPAEAIAALPHRQTAAAAALERWKATRLSG